MADICILGVFALLGILVGYKVLVLWRPVPSRLWPKFPAETVRLTATERINESAKLFWGVPFIGLLGTVFPFIGLGFTVLEISRALVSVGGGALSVEQMIAPIGAALHFTFYGIIGAIASLFSHHVLQNRIDYLEQLGEAAFEQERAE